MKSFLFAFVFLSIVACGGDLVREDVLPDANGAHGEVFVIVDKGLWEGPIGEEIDRQLSKDAEGVYLRQESVFNYFRKPSDNVNHINKLSRLILKVFIDKDSAYKETCLLEKENYYANNQLFLIIKDSDGSRLVKYIKENFDICIDKFNAFELKQLITQYKSKPNRNVKEIAEKKFGLSISLPKRSELKVDKDNFIWVKRERSKNFIPDESKGNNGGTFWIQQGMIFWAEKYKDSSQMTVEGVLQKRDTILKYNIPGELKGSYMATEYDEYYSPMGSIFDYKDVKTVRIQGLWKHAGNESAFGGGPFLQHTFLHPTNGMVITICGYIFAPKFDKREYLREIDAMLRTVEFI